MQKMQSVFSRFLVVLLAVLVLNVPAAWAAGKEYVGATGEFGLTTAYNSWSFVLTWTDATETYTSYQQDILTTKSAVTGVTKLGFWGSTDIINQSGTTYKRAYNIYTTNNAADAYVGYTVTVAPGYYFTLQSITGAFAVSDNITWKVTVEDKNGTVIYSNQKTISNYSKSSRSNMTFSDSGLETDARRQELTGTLYVKVYATFSGTKYYSLPKLNISGDVYKDPHCQNLYDFVYKDGVNNQTLHTMNCFEEDPTNNNILFTREMWFPSANKYELWSKANVVIPNTEADLSTIPHGPNNAWQMGANSAGALGRFRIYENSLESNKHISFYPSEYTLQIGTQSSYTAAWDTTHAILPNSSAPEETVWYTDTLDLSKIALDKNKKVTVSNAQVWVGFEKYVSPYYMEMPKSGRVSLSTVPGVSGRASDRGKFRINSGANSTNLDLTFVPYYRITYDNNGGSGTINPSDEVPGDGDDAARTLTTAAGTFTRTNYTFAGWNTAANGSGVSYAAGDPITLTANITLYAQWKGKATVVTLNGNGIGANGTVTLYYGETWSAATDFTPVQPVDGYTITGYATAASRGTEVIHKNNDGTWTLKASVSNYTDRNGKWNNTNGTATLYAQYTVDQGTCGVVGTNGTIKANNTDYKLATTTVRTKGLTYNTTYADFDNGDDNITIQNTRGIEWVKIKAWYPGAEDHLYAHYSEDGTNWSSTEWIRLSNTEPAGDGWTLSVPAGTKYIRIEHTRPQKVRVSNICVKEGNSGKPAPVINWTTRPQDAKVGAVVPNIVATASIPATSGYPNPQATVTGYYSTSPQYATVTNLGAVTYVTPGMTTICPEVTVRYFSGDAEHMFVGSYEPLQVISVDGCLRKVLMWKETALFDGSEANTYTYSYTPANHYPNTLRLEFFQGIGVSSSNKDRAMENEGSALTTGKFEGCGFVFYPVGVGAKFSDKIQFFGKMEAGAFEYTIDGTNWLDYVAGTNSAVSITTGTVGSDAVHTIDIATSIPAFGIRNKGTNGAAHKGMWIRNMSITVCSDGEDCEAPRLTNQSSALTYLEGDQGVTLSVTPDYYSYQWYRCNYQGAKCEEISGATSNTLTFTSEQLPNAGTTYYVCHIHQSDCEAVTHSRVFAVTRYPTNPLVRWELAQSQTTGSGITTTNTYRQEDAHISSVSTFVPHDGAAPSNNTFVGAMTTRLKVTETAMNESVYDVFTFHMEDQYYLVPTEILLEVQPISYESEMFRAVLEDETGQRIEGSLNRPASGVGNLVSFAYDRNIRLQGEIKLKLYAWDAGHNDALYRLGTHVSIYGEVLQKPLPELTWVIAPENGKENAFYVILAESPNTTNPVTYSSSDPSLAFWNDLEQKMRYNNPGKVTIYATVTGDGYYSVGTTTIGRTIIIDKESPESNCTVPGITLTGDDSGIKSFCELEVSGNQEPYSTWLGLTASDNTQIQPTERRIIQWFKDGNEVAFEEFESNYSTGTTNSLTYKPTEPGVYKAIVTVYNDYDLWATKQSVEKSVRFRLLEAPDKPTISGPSTVEQTRRISLTAQSVGASSYIWYMQAPGHAKQRISGDGPSVTFATDANTEIGRYYFYCEGSTLNFPDDDDSHECNTSELSSAFAVDVVAATGCDWHYKLDETDAVANNVDVCQHITFVDNEGNIMPFNQNWTVTGCVLEDQSFAFSKVTSPVIPMIDFPVMEGHTGTGYMYVRGDAILQYKENHGATTNFALSSASKWQLFTLPLDATDANKIYTITSDRPIQIAICAAHVCQEMFDDWNIPTLLVDNDGACGSVNLTASGYNPGAKLTLMGQNEAGQAIASQVVESPAAVHNFSVSESGSYWVVSSNNDESKQANSVLRVVHVNSAPVFNSSNPLPNDLQGYVGRTYSVTADIAGAETYQWYLCTQRSKSDPGAMILPLEGETNKTFTRPILPAYLAEDRYNFFCVGSNDCGSAETNIMHLTALEDQNPEGQECTNPTLYFEPTETTIDFDDPFTEPTLHKTEGLRVTFSSSSPMVATVDPETGVVTQVSVGTTYISAHSDEQVLRGVGSEDVLYCEKDVYYTLTINATSPEHFPTVTSTGTELSCGGLTLTVKNNTADYGVGTTFQWYRNHIAITDATEATFTATAAGTYDVRVTSGYAKWSNSILITDANMPTVEKFAPFQYYRKGCRYDLTTDQPLRHLFKVSPKGTGTPWQVKGFKRTQDGLDNREMVNNTILSFVRPDPSNPNVVILDLKSMEEMMSSTASVQVGDTVIIVCTPRDGCNNFNPFYADSVAIPVVNRDRRSLAYIVSGGNKNDEVLGSNFLTGYNLWDLRMQSSLNSWSLEPTPLYRALSSFYDVTPVNGYAFDNLSGTNIYQYEPFDVLVLTDYVHANMTKIGSETSTSYVDALANLVDFRPMLLLNSCISGDESMLPTWYSKGFNAQRYTPIVDSPTEALSMYALCPDHKVYEFLTAQIPVNPGDAIQVVTTAGLDHNKALSGFRLSDLTGFSNISTIGNNGEKSFGSSMDDVVKEPLVYSFERQKTPSARLVMMPVDVYATSVISTRGTELARGILKYLLLDNVTLSDCGFIFDNRAGDGLWSTAGNWAPRYSAVPTTGADVRIMTTCTVPAGTVTNGVGKVTLYDGGKMVVEPAAALRSWGGVGVGTSLEQHPLSEPERLLLKSSAAGNAALIHGDHVGQTKATVEMYSNATGAWDGAHSLFTPVAWQWMTTPFTDLTDVQNHYYGSWINEWDNENKNWVEVLNHMPMTPFKGYCITQETAQTYSMQGTLASTSNVTLEATFKGKRAYLFGNSWTAPIHIYEFLDEDFENLDKNIVLFNAGLSPRDERVAGQYVSVPIHNAHDMGITIPSMQSFQVKAIPSASGENTHSGKIRLHLNYDRLVQFTGDSRDMILEPMRAPSRGAMKQEDLHNGNTAKLVLTIQGESLTDCAYLFENPACSSGYDNGWDGAKVMGGADAPQLFILNEAGNWAVSTQNEWEGTQVALRRGADENYTFTFDYVGSDRYYLYDAQSGIYTPITNDTQYQFTTTADMEDARFFITRQTPHTPTGDGGCIGGFGADGKREVYKFIQDDVIYISVDGTIYTVDGRIVR